MSEPNNISLRCSSLPLAFKCAESVLPGEPPINPRNEIATMGTAVHEALAFHVETHDCPDLNRLASEYEIDEEELTRLFWAGTRMWKTLADLMPEAKTEVALMSMLTSDDGTRTATLTGHADALSQVTLALSRVVDWKSGYLEGEYANQVIGYAYLQWAGMGRPQDAEVEVILAYPRLGNIKRFTYTARELDAWATRVKTEIIGRVGTFQPGAHCGRCKRYHTCPGRGAITQSISHDIALRAGLAPKSLRDLEPVQINLITAKLGYLKGLVKEVEDAIRMEVEHGGPLPTGEGKALQLVPVPRDSINAREAWPVISEYLSDDEINGCLRVVKKDMLDAIGEKQPRGQKGKAKQAVIELLKDAGAITTTESFRLMNKQLPEEGGEDADSD